MRISDWSSDVCSSDLAPEEVPGMNYVELHIGDYEKATAHLTAIEDGIYGRLLRRYYDAEGPLVADLKALQRLVRARTRDERGAVENILEEFFYLADDGRSEEHTSELQ